MTRVIPDTENVKVAKIAAALHIAMAAKTSIAKEDRADAVIERFKIAYAAITEVTKDQRSD